MVQKKEFLQFLCKILKGRADFYSFFELNMENWKDLADLLFPEVTGSIDELLTKYPERSEKVCDRIAPSPTGYFHFGNLFTALLNRKYAKQQQGIFYIRIEDTDQQRKVDDAVDVVLKALKKF